MFWFCPKKVTEWQFGARVGFFSESTVGHSSSAARYLLHLLGYRRGFKVLAIGGWFG
jgi:hypothetical protein